eukprot:CAMPEP_0182946958 /NCGR_PEP_ID=MMETSP0105_2-20130417/57813_1 /TAXON_ID=81532 ORGANISM="Acanthoeca-like sp., Strain 10tr" /NCGR_SAMPLE_ID=MMETSP0105_2 /ASSEMBLY_ACC=CAM_ASM_000205 /LENGTH=61 /DNA_ID=CAMNT_0025087141 /DNA_START=8 /DNA_END=191 /DNA_ORIENTATION=+
MAPAAGQDDGNGEEWDEPEANAWISGQEVQDALARVKADVGNDADIQMSVDIQNYAYTKAK